MGQDAEGLGVIRAIFPAVFQKLRSLGNQHIRVSQPARPAPIDRVEVGVDLFQPGGRLRGSLAHGGIPCRW